MKRVFFVTLAAVMMLAACKKDVEKPQPKAFDPYDDRAVEARIKEFNQKLQQKSGEPMTIEDAVWCIEATLNYNYCRAGMHTSNILLDTLNIEISSQNNLVSFEEIIKIYFDIEKHLNKITDNYNIFPTLIDIQSEKEINNCIISAFLVLCTNRSKSTTFPNSFNQSWKWGFLKGDCNGNFIGQKDATTELTYWLNSFIIKIPGTYYTDIEYNQASFANYFINPNDNIPYDNYLDYLIFTHLKYHPLTGALMPNYIPYESNWGYCISASEMTFYAWSYRSLLLNNLKPFGKNLINSIVNYGIDYDCNGNTCTSKRYYHILTGYYGILRYYDN